MADTLDKLQHIYAKWEGKGPKSKHHINGTVGGYQKTLDSGRQAWRNKFKNVGPPPVRRTRQRFKPQPVATFASVRTSAIAFYKTTPTIFPITDRIQRPYNGRCCSCMPTSRNTAFEEEFESKGLHDILRVDTNYGDRDWLTRRFCHLAFVWQRDVSHKYPDVSMAVLTSPRIVEAIQKKIQEDKGVNSVSDIEEKELAKLTKTEKKKAAGIIKRMKATISNRLIRFTGWFLHKLLGHLLSSIVVHQGQMAALKKACEQELPIIFLPTHRSHLDYILLTFILFNYDIQAPHVAAGDNLYLPFFSLLMKGLGGYFIRRRLNPVAGKKDHLYRALLHTYMEELLVEGQYFEFFIEGGRTRSGKALYPKSGLLSVVVDTYMTGAIPDALIVPVGISYEKLLDGNFNKEQMGEPKNKETFWNAVSGIVKVMRSCFGSVRVDFAQPFSLKEYLQVSHSFLPSNPHLSGWTSNPSSPGTVTALRSSGSSNSLGYMAAEDHRSTIQGLAEHIVHGCVGCQSIMSTHVLAFLLLTKHREGVSLKTLIPSMDSLRSEILLHSRDLGFSGKSKDVILHAAQLLGPGLVQLIPQKNNVKKKEVSSEDQNNNESTEENLFVKPNLSLPDVFELAYYSNTVSCVFAMDSILAAAVFSEVDLESWIQPGHEFKISVSRNKVIDKAKDLCNIFTYEYILKLPCQNWDSVLSDAVDRFVNSDIFMVDEESSTGYQSRMAKSLSWEDSDSEDDCTVFDTIYTLNTEDTSAQEKLQFLREVLAPLLETYYITSCHLLHLESGPRGEDDLTKMIHKILKQRVHDGVASYAESVSLDSVKNAIKSFEVLRAITKLQDGTENGKKQVELYNGSPERVNWLITTLQNYRQ